MRLLLDTCTFLWLASGDAQLSAAAQTAIRNPDNEVFLSAVSAWEIAVKHSLGRLNLPSPPGRFVPEQREAHWIESLPLDEESAVHIARLPVLHSDPFDRMLIAQALAHGLTLVTPDETIARYPARVLW